jgi:hypothetical protein
MKEPELLRAALAIVTANTEHVGYDILVNRLFYHHPGFKTWIESTPLFKAIVAATRGAIGQPEIERRITYVMENETFDLTIKGGKEITKAEELPVELLKKFYENSPYYSTQKNDDAHY